MKNKITIVLCFSLVLILMSVFLPFHHGLAQTTPDPNYHLLQPLPGTGGNQPLTDFDPTSGSAFGTYLKIIIQLFIGLCAVLAVVMIVIGGIEYATSELISSKEAGKDRIRGAILGLLLALGAYTILFQINPDLLNTNIDIGGATLSVEIKDFIVENESYTGPVPSDSGPLPTGRMPGCSSSVVWNKNHTMKACPDIVQNLDNMIDAASAAGFKLTGGGFRSEDQQFALRTKHCGAGNEYNPSASCSVPTAVPGRSMHQSGLAFDLNCNGSLIPRYATVDSNACFAWLSANAANYHFYNLQTRNPQRREGWHWSINGR